MHRLHLTTVDPAKQIKIAKALRGIIPDVTLTAANKVVQDFLVSGQPVVIFSDEDYEAVEAALTLLRADTDGAADGVIDLDDTLAAEAATAEQDEEEGTDFELAVYETGYVLLAGTEGNPMRAVIMALSLKNSTKDDLFEAVSESIQSAFPPLREAFEKAESEE